jgi:hypothetical protein
MGGFMRVENLLTIFGVLIVALGYAVVIAALVDFDFVREQRNVYLIGGVGGVLWGTLMLGIAKAINQQLNLVLQMEDMRRLLRAHAKSLSELRGAKSSKAASTAPNAKVSSPKANSVKTAPQ